MRIVLIGAVESTAVTLKSMVDAGHAPIAVVSLEPTLAHRHSDFVDMKSLADAIEVPFLSVRSANAPEAVERIAALKPDWLVVVGWSQIVHEPLMRTARLGCIGYHPSPLPEMRGRAVLAWTILLGRVSTASTLFKLEPTVDSGDILAQQSFAVEPRETLPTLMNKHMSALDQMWTELLPQMACGAVIGVPQDASHASFCAKRTVADGRIDWTASVEDIDRLIRAVTAPYPGAFSQRGGDQLIIWEAEPWRGAPHFGSPGQVLSVGAEGMLIACRRGEVLNAKRWSWNKDSHAAAPRVAERLH